MTYYSTSETFDNELNDYLERFEEVEEFDPDYVHDIVFEDLYEADGPDFCDAWISEAYYKNELMTDKELEDFQEDYATWIHEKKMEHFRSK